MTYKLYIISSGGTNDYANQFWLTLREVRREELIAQLGSIKQEIMIDENGAIVENENDSRCCIWLAKTFSFDTKKEVNAFKAGFNIAREDDDDDDWKQYGIFIYEVQEQSN